MTSVIVIEDDIESMEVLCEFLQIKELDVIGKGKNGKEAIELYEQLRPDAVIMDLMMPEFDGFYGLEGIRKIDPLSTIVIITADMTSDTEEKLESMKASKILYKPNDVDKITPAIEKLIDEKSDSMKVNINF